MWCQQICGGEIKQAVMLPGSEGHTKPSEEGNTVRGPVASVLALEDAIGARLGAEA